MRKPDLRRRNAEHQRAYRERHLNNPDTVDASRINMLVAPVAKAALERLARAYRVSQRAALERVLREAEGDFVDALPPGEREAYYAGPNR